MEHANSIKMHFKVQRPNVVSAGSTAVLLSACATALPHIHFKFDFCANERRGERQNQEKTTLKTIIDIYK